MYYVASLAFLPILIAAIIGFIRWGIASKRERFLIGLMFIACASELISSALWRQETNNMIVSHIFTPIEFALLTYYFSENFKRRTQQLFYATALGFAVFALLNAFVWNSHYEMNKTPRTIECILLIALSLLIYGKIMHSFTQEKLTDLPVFWFNSAVILYFSSNILLFYFSHFVANLSNDMSIWIWSIHLIFMTIYYLLFSIGLWKIHRKAH